MFPDLKGTCSIKTYMKFNYSWQVVAGEGGPTEGFRREGILSRKAETEIIVPYKIIISYRQVYCFLQLIQNFPTASPHIQTSKKHHLLFISTPSTPETNLNLIPQIS